MSVHRTARKHGLRNLPVHIILIGLCAIWLIPTIGLLITSFRPVQDINSSGWWTIFSKPKGYEEYQTYCSVCHGDDGSAIPEADLSDPDLVQNYRRSFSLLPSLSREIDGQPHMADSSVPDETQTAAIISYMRRISGLDSSSRLTLDNYIDAFTGYRGNNTYRADCASGKQSVDLYCDIRDLLNPRGMGRAFMNSLFVAVPSTVLPILIASFAAYAFSWMDFKGRQWLFALLVGLQVVPLQMTLIPVSRLYAQLGMNSTFLGIWLFHTGFGLPYAIYLIRNFMGGLPREIFESAYIDGASHWTAFWKLCMPLSIPALASLTIFQFLWIWNDLLVALVFLGGQHPVLTYQIGNMVTSLGAGWHLLTAAAFISMALPMLLFLLLQKYFVRGMLAGSVKG